jgi:hypothetical protein
MTREIVEGYFAIGSREQSSLGGRHSRCRKTTRGASWRQIVGRLCQTPAKMAFQEKRPYNYSVLSASIGFTRLARRAGVDETRQVDPRQLIV